MVRATVREKIAWALAVTLGLFVVAAVAGVTEGGPLDPPGPPASTEGVRLPGTPISGLPFAASQPGHYYVTKNLVGPGGITVTASDVSIDLGGFTLTGVSTTPGIDIDPVMTGTVIRNGSLRNWTVGIRQFASDDLDTEIVIQDVNVANTTSHGMQLASRIRIHGCSVAAAGGNGITVGAGPSIIEGCTVRGAVGIGIQAGFSTTVRDCDVSGVTTSGGAGTALFSSSLSLIEDCRFHGNNVSNVVSLGATGSVARVTIEGNTVGFNALNLSQGGSVRDSTVRANTAPVAIRGTEAIVVENTVVDGNSGVGIQVTSRAVIRGNNVTNNGGDGISVGEGSVVASNAVADNGADGIEATEGARIIDNAVRLNGDDAAIANGAGIRLTGPGNYVTGNVLSSNDIGIASGVAPSVIVRNSARNHAVANYQFQPGDLTGVDVTAANELTNSVQHFNDAP